MLYLISTPIGNLGEITLRAIETLKLCDYILCEDTRTSSILLNHLNIKKKLVAYHKFNEKSMSEKIIEDLKSGLNIALISDAGMPGISDPGNVMVNECYKNNLEVTVISGPSAFVNAFVLSGFQPPFMFIGFLPTKNSEKKELLNSLKLVNSCLIFYVSPHDMQNFYLDVNKYFNNRNSFVVRELTKKFEEKTFVNKNEVYEGLIKGEFVVVFDKPCNNVFKISDVELESEIKTLLNEKLSKLDISKEIAIKYNLSKNIVYKKVIEISGKK